MPKINADVLNLEEQVIRTNKVQKTHKGGRTLSWSVLVAVGDHNGHVGIGLGKAAGIPDAIRKGIEEAKKNIIEVPMVGTTIPHDIEMDFGAAKVRMKPASPGTGVVAGGAVRPILELAGVRDVLAKSLGSPNAVNTAKATIKCFENLRVAERVAELRGKSLEEMVPWLVRKRREEAMAAGGEFGGPDVSGEEAEELVEAVEAE
jgi:small subunit ribosomal protein S5